VAPNAPAADSSEASPLGSTIGPTRGPTDIAPAPGYLGMVMTDRDQNGRGILVVRVDPESPAAIGAIEPGDVITHVNDVRVKQIDQLRQFIIQAPPGARFSFDIENDGFLKRREVTTTPRPDPASQPFAYGQIPPEQMKKLAEKEKSSTKTEKHDDAPAVPAESSHAVLGVGTVAVLPSDQRRFRLPSLRGALVVAIVPDSPAEMMRLPIESVVVAIDRQQIESPIELARCIAQYRSGDRIDVSFYVDGKLMRGSTTLTAIRPVDAE
jgi:S1-C subfamily serine protease